MSRLHDLLKEKTRSSERPNGHSASSEHAISFDRIDSLKQVNESEKKRAAERNRTAAADHSPPGNESLLPENSTAQNNDFASAGKLHVDRKLPTLSNVVDSSVTEHYRRLRTKILQQQAAKPFRTLVVTSPSPEEGKTLTVLNLGWSFAMLPSFKILVVDGDLRRGSLGACLGMAPHPGLSNFIEGSAQLEDVVLKCEDVPLHFVGRGNAAIPPAELLQSCELKAKFNQLAEPFSLILVDSPPANLITDVQLLAGSCDAVLMMARAFSTTKKAFEGAVQELSSFRVIGSVLNGATRPRQYSRYRGYYY